MAVECFQSQFEVYEDADPDTSTPFEEAVADLPNQLNEEPSHFAGDTQCVISAVLQEAWKKACVCRYGIILFGFDDVRPGDPNGLREPVKVTKYPGRRLLYIRVFDETNAPIGQWDTDQASPRYGRPLYYNINLANPTIVVDQIQSGASSPPDALSYTRQVHFSRVLHVCKTDGDHPYYHKPECQDVIKYVTNLQKVYGANSEGHWKGAFATISIETTNPDVTPNRDELKTMIEEWDRGLLKVWALDGGLTAKTVPVSIQDPTAAIEVNLRAISMRKRIPKRKLEGSERGELASGQDDGDWNDVVRAFQYNILNPRLLIPFYDRLINVGVLPMPGKAPKIPKSTKPEGLNGAVGRNGNGNGVKLGEPFKTQDGEMVSPVLSTGDPTNPTMYPRTNPTPELGNRVNGRTVDSIKAVPSPPPPPRNGQLKKEGGYYIFWPDIANQTDDDKVKIGAQVIAAVGDAIGKGVLNQITLRDVLVGMFRGVFSEDEVDAWLENAEQAREEQDTVDHHQAQAEMELQQQKIDAGLAISPAEEQKKKDEAVKRQEEAETEAKMNAIDQSSSMPIGNAEDEWDGYTWGIDELDEDTEVLVPLTNAAKQQLTGGRWITTDEGHHVYLKGGRPVAGNPAVIAKMKGGGTGKKQKKSGNDKAVAAHEESNRAWGSHGKATAGKMDHEEAAKHHEKAATMHEKVLTAQSDKAAKEHREAAEDLRSRAAKSKSEKPKAPESKADQKTTTTQTVSTKASSSAKVYKSGDEAEKDLAPSAKQWAEDPNKPLSNQAIYGYAGTSDSFYINDCLRKKCKDNALNKTADDLAGVIDKASFPKDVTTHRTINTKSESEKKEILKKFRSNIGKTIVDNAFVSTTANKEYADSWSDFAKERLGATGALKVEVVVPKGSKAIYIPKGIAVREEWEVLIQRGSKFKVLSVDGTNIKIEVANG
jgi:hypothetical protein